MDILLTGGTGYIGKAVLARLLAVGHDVTAVVRSDESAAIVEEAGARALVGSLFAPEWLADELETVQAAIHTAAASDETDADLNAAVIDAVTNAFEGTDKPFIHTGGIWTYGSGATITETDTPNPPAITGWRIAGEQKVLDASHPAAVIQPGIVYGHGGGIPAMIAAGPRTQAGELVLVGSGDQHWTTIHVDDLGDLYLAVLDALVEGAEGGSYIGASGDNPTVREIGEALGTVTPGSDDEAQGRFGAPFAEALLLDQQATAAKARSLGWVPGAPTLVELLKAGYPADR